MGTVQKQPYKSLCGIGHRRDMAIHHTLSFMLKNGLSSCPDFPQLSLHLWFWSLCK